MTAFELNELLKDDLVLNHGAIEAKTIFFKEGVLLMPEPFYETSVLWERDTSMKELQEAFDTFNKYREKINNTDGYVSKPIFEYSLGRPNLLWSTFLTRDPATGLYDNKE
jgi:hypothetical protein